VASGGYTHGLHEVGDGLYAYLQPDGGWGWSNAGLVSDGEHSLLIDTLFDLQLTERMLAEMRRAVLGTARIETVLNTHANGDHCYGNQLVADARILASQRAFEEMSELPPAAMATLVEQAPNMGELGEFFLRCFGGFDFSPIELTLPSETFTGELTVGVGDREVRLIEVGPTHTGGDTIAWLAAERVLFTGDVLFNGGHPIVWAGPVSNWIAACDLIVSLDPAVVVPGHGPLAGLGEVRELRAYFEYLYERARECHSEGMSAIEAARSLSLDRWAAWGERERLVVNVACIYAEIEGGEPPGALEAFTQMAELAADGRR
jgi:glyoxylase-like metal-dependent hydrolase (beta-lactamase superfamily II)